MADLVATDSLSLALQKLQTLIAAMEWFQQWAGDYVFNQQGERLTNEDGEYLQIQLSADDAAGKVLIGAVGYNVPSCGIASGVGTVVTAQPHNLEAGQAVTLEGIGEDFDGIREVASVVDETTFTYAIDAADAASATRSEGIVMQVARPFVMLQQSEDDGHSSQTIASGNTSIVKGAIDIVILGEISPGYANHPRNALVEMNNFYGGFIDALREISGTDDYMLLNSIEQKSRPSFVKLQQQGDNQSRYTHWEAVIRVTWGLEG